ATICRRAPSELTSGHSVAKACDETDAVSIAAKALQKNCSKSFIATFRPRWTSGLHAQLRRMVAHDDELERFLARFAAPQRSNILRKRVWRFLGNYIVGCPVEDL